MTSPAEWFQQRWQPITTAIGMLLGAVGIYVGMSHPLPRPTFVVSPTRARILDASATADSADSLLEVRFDGRELRHQSVTAAVVYFWNAGAAPIRASDVLAPFTIDVSDAAEILDAKVVGQSRSVVDMSVK